MIISYYYYYYYHHTFFSLTFAFALLSSWDIIEYLYLSGDFYFYWVGREGCGWVGGTIFLLLFCFFNSTQVPVMVGWLLRWVYGWMGEGGGRGGEGEGKRSIFTLVNYANLSYRDTSMIQVWERKNRISVVVSLSRSLSGCGE